MDKIVCDDCGKAMVEKVLGSVHEGNKLEHVKTIEIAFGTRNMGNCNSIIIDLCETCGDKLMTKLKKILPRVALEQLNKVYLERLKGDKKRRVPTAVPDNTLHEVSE